jgi:hypothetical protein
MLIVAPDAESSALSVKRDVPDWPVEGGEGAVSVCGLKRFEEVERGVEGRGAR